MKSFPMSINLIFFFFDPTYAQLWLRKNLFFLFGDVIANVVFVVDLKWLSFELLTPFSNFRDEVRSYKSTYFDPFFGASVNSNNIVLNNNGASSFSRHRQKPIVNFELLWKLYNRISASESILHQLNSIAFQGMIAFMCGKTKQLSKRNVILHHDALGTRQGKFYKFVVLHWLLELHKGILPFQPFAAFARLIFFMIAVGLNFIEVLRDSSFLPEADLEVSIQRILVFVKDVLGCSEKDVAW